MFYFKQVDSTSIKVYNSKNSFSMYANSEKPFILVVAARHLPSNDKKNNDFGSFMPTPITCTGKCFNILHYYYLLNNEYFMIRNVDNIYH